MPSPDDLPEILEIVVGQSTDRDYQTAMDWLDKKHQETNDKYGSCLPALDVEDGGLIFTTIEHSWQELGIQMIISDGVLDPIVSGPKATGSRFNYPVLLMYG
jgi:hypothetical protein